MKLIVNADDYGMTKGVNLGIIEAHKNGIVTSTTLMVTILPFTASVMSKDLAVVISPY